MKQLLLIMSTRYKAGKGKDREVIDEHLNSTLKSDLKLRPLITVMKATDHERQIFRENSRFYVMKKSQVCAGICVWYDWQMYANVSAIFDTFGSLYAICKRGGRR